MLLLFRTLSVLVNVRHENRILLIMKYAFLALLLLFGLSSCTNKDATKTLGRANLKTQEFKINTDRDTTLRTTNGALINIPKGAIVSDDGSAVSIQVKEAYSPKDMVLAGLVTQAGGEPLSSGGMIYINTAPGQSAHIVKPIRIAVPSSYRQEGMQLYQGDTTGGEIDWKKPTSMADNAQTQAFLKGQELFKTKCASCHGIGQGRGVDLAHFEKRFPYNDTNARYWYFHDPVDYIKHIDASLLGSDSAKVGSLPGLNELWWGRGDLYVCNLINLNNNAIAPPQGLGFGELKSIYDYVQNESDRLNLPLPSHAYLKDCVDSCYAYRKTVLGLQQQKADAEQKKNDLKADNGPMTKNDFGPIDTTTVSTPIPAVAGPSLDFDSLVTPLNANAEYYQFTVEAFGWYNVDILLKNLPGVEPAELFVKLDNRKWTGLSVNLILPSVKANVSGGKMESDDKYVFYKNNGKIPLPIGAKGYILALSESGEEMAYALTSFVVSRSQELSLSLKKTTKDEFAKAMSALDEEGLKVTVADSKNADEIRKTDGQLKTINENLKKAESLKPKRCDCDCSYFGEEGGDIFPGSPAPNGQQ